MFGKSGFHDRSFAAAFERKNMAGGYRSAAGDSPRHRRSEGLFKLRSRCCVLKKSNYNGEVFQHTDNRRRRWMKRFWVILAVILMAVPLVMAAAPKTYQVTGPILDLKDDMIVVEKAKERWEIARDKETKVKGDLKVGSKVTVEYRMVATSVEVKDKK